MSRLSTFNLLVLFGTIVYVGLVGLVVYGYSKVTPFAMTQQTEPKPAQLEAPQPKAESKVETPKKDEPRNDEPAPRFEIRRKFPDNGFRGFPKRPRMTTLSDRIGVRIEKPGEDTIVQLGLVEGSGLMVEEVRENSPAAAAGLRIGDIILEMGGRGVPGDPLDFNFQLGDLKTGEPIDVEVLREGKMETVKGLIVPEAAPRFFGFPKRDQ